MEYKDTLNLPRTDFPMKGNLPQREPEILARWQRDRLYQQMLAANADKPRFVLHDGPPYANGNTHLGHTLNKVLKDIIVKHRAMTGRMAPYVPGWDCHGLPIELQVEKKLGRAKKDAMSKVDVRKLCRQHAERFVGIQSEEFQRLGILGDWEHPYLTMDFGFEADEVRVLGQCIAAGYLFRGKKPVHWCWSCATALAEAEVEYADVTSPAVYVVYRLNDPLPAALAGLTGVGMVAWTTTPWTLPASLAVAVHPDHDYVAVDLGTQRVIVAHALVPLLTKALKLATAPAELAVFKGRDLDGVSCRHPWIERSVPVVMADYVTLDSGTGVVHTAPGHGQDDYQTGLRCGLDVYAPVDARGRFTDDVPEWAGERVLDANAKIVEHLRQVGTLLAAHDFSHSYPHCWRCKNPIIFRATEQWFLRMDHQDLRQRALREIERVRWVPEWGQERIHNMIATRPDWCLSRQRDWGVPMVALHCSGCGDVFTNQALCEHVAAIFDREGADAWFARPVNELVPAGTQCGKCGGATFEKEKDILDVWFDSGVSWSAVMGRRPELGGHADLYLEGSDQHRGWFHSALLTSVALADRAPYDIVLTHGFTRDAAGRKESKSLGNTTKPSEIINKLGAELLRLWVAAEDYRDDVRISDEIFAQLVEAYRRVRNTVRFLLSNLYDFDPATHSVPHAQLPELERWALHRTALLLDRCQRAYEGFEFHLVYHALNNFCSVDLSSLYLDVRKDRLYCERPDSPERRATQTVLHHMCDVLLRVMAPVLSFTADEAWQHLPRSDRPASVFLAGMLPAIDGWRDEALGTQFDQLLEVRATAMKALEEARSSGFIKVSAEARLQLTPPDAATATLLTERAAELPALFLVGQVVVGPVGGAMIATVEKADGGKCERCWTVRALGSVPAHPMLCSRCAAAVA